jgi:hypothetical protein
MLELPQNGPKEQESAWILVHVTDVMTSALTQFRKREYVGSTMYRRPQPPAPVPTPVYPVKREEHPVKWPNTKSV